jgi:hypothetical protein
MLPLVDPSLFLLLWLSLAPPDHTARFVHDVSSDYGGVVRVK